MLHLLIAIDHSPQQLQFKMVPMGKFPQICCFFNLFLANVRTGYVFRKSGHRKELTGKWGTTKAEKENCTKFQCNVLRPNGFAVQIGPINRLTTSATSSFQPSFSPNKKLCAIQRQFLFVFLKDPRSLIRVWKCFLQLNLYIGSIWNESVKFFTVFLIFWIYPALALAVRRNFYLAENSFPSHWDPPTSITPVMKIMMILKKIMMIIKMIITLIVIVVIISNFGL